MGLRQFGLCRFVATALVAGFLCSAEVLASSITYTVGPVLNGPINNNPVAAEADFVLTSTPSGPNFNYTMTIDLKNTLVMANGDSLAPNQFLSQLDFNLSGATIGPVNVASQTAPNGSITYNAVGSPPIYGTINPAWTFPAGPTGYTFQLNGILGRTKQMIAPKVAPDGNVFFNNGTGNFNPYIYQDAFFTLNFTAATADITVSGAAFNFGTQQGEFTGTGTPNTVPTDTPEIDPASATSAFACLAMGVALINQRRGKKSAV